MKMFKKEKITEKDVGLLEDAFVFLCHAVADESHCLGNYMSTGNEQDLKDLEEARRLRTFVADKITEGIKNQNWCFVPNTKIITKEGMKNIEEVQIGDFTLTHKNRFRKVVNKMNRNINEEIISLKTNYSNIPLEVTKNHLFYVADNLREPQKKTWKKNYEKPKFVWKKAEELNRKDFLYLPRYNFIKDVDKIFVEYKTYCKNKFGKSKEKFIDNVEINVNNNFMRLIGLYLAEGHHYEGFESKHGYPSGYVGFSFSLKEEDFSKFVYETMGHHFFNYRKPTYRKSTIEFCYGKRIIRKFFGQFGSHANNKKIPEWVINLPQDKLKFLIKGMIEGDGCVSKYSINYSTVSKELAYGFRLILNKLGILCSIKNQGKSKDSVIDGRVIKSRFDLYSLSVSGDSARKLANLLDLKYDGGKKTSGNFGYTGKDYFLIPILKVEKINYLGEVYNLEVEEDNSYCTFNGIAHNCRIKHICGKAMTCQELITRYLSMKDLEKAKELAEEYKKLYLEYLKILGVTEKNMKLKSSA